MMNTAITPEVMTEFSSNSEVIPSASIDRILIQRKHALSAFKQGMELIRQAQTMMKEVTKHHMYGFTDIAQHGIASQSDESCLMRMTRLLDSGIWSRLMNETGMLTMMSHTQISEWQDSLNTEKMPEATLDNILASFKLLHQNKGQIFEQGIVDLFKKLSWDYKTNCPCKLGNKIIVNYMVGNSYSNACYRPTDEGRNKLNDLEKMMCLLDGKNVPDHRIAAGAAFYDFTSANQWNGEKYEHEYFSVKYYKKRSGHIIFKRPDLVEKLNDIITRHHPGALPPRV